MKHTQETKSPKSWLRAAVAAITLSLVLAVFPHLYDMWEDRMHKSDYWFEYFSVTPTKNHFTIGEPITYISDAVFYRDFPIEWHDTLRCDYYDDDIGMVRISSYITKSPTRVSKGRVQAAWTYNGTLPKQAGECITVHTITAANRWADVSYTYVGPVFYIVDSTG